MTMRRLFAVMLPFALAAGCAGIEDDDDGVVTPGRDGGAIVDRDGGAVVDRDGGVADRDGGVAERDGGAAQVAFAETRGILLQRCQPCHDVGNQRNRIVVSNYDLIVDRPSPATQMPYVTPGDPDNSWIYRKITNTHADVCRDNSIPVRNCGGIMPTNQGTALTQAQIDAVRDWIIGGAGR